MEDETKIKIGLIIIIVCGVLSLVASVIQMFIKN